MHSNNKLLPDYDDTVENQMWCGKHHVYYSKNYRWCAQCDKAMGNIGRSPNA